VMDGFLSKKTVQHVVEILESSKRRKKMVSNNYTIASRHYSYALLRNQLTVMMKSFFGDSVGPLVAKLRPSKPNSRLYMNSKQVMYRHFESKSCARAK